MLSLSSRMTSRQVYQTLGMQQPTFNIFLRSPGMFSPLVDAIGRKGQIFSVQQAWAIGIAKSVRAGGQSMEIAVAIANFLASLRPIAVETAFAEGRTCLMVTNTDGELMLKPRLLAADSITANPELKRAQRKAVRAGKTLQFYGLDVRPMLDQLVAAVTK